MDYQCLISPSKEAIGAFIRYVHNPIPKSYLTGSATVTVPARALANSKKEKELCIMHRYNQKQQTGKIKYPENPQQENIATPRSSRDKK